jgi:hypothetical protein
MGELRPGDSRAADVVENRIEIDDWATESFWTSIRSRYGALSGERAESDREAVVKARYVVFANGTGAFLPEERKIIEISDLLDGRAAIEDIHDKYPRKHASELEEGDLVVLRLTGSGDYLEQVADSMMSKEGKADLRSRATQWKHALKGVLEAHGSEKIAEMLKREGYVLSGHRYIWIWTTDLVISPQNRDEFHTLIRAVCSLGGLPGAVAAEYASVKWELMRELKRYHMQAGRQIRDAMLSKLSQLISERTVIREFHRIVLPGVDAGEMGLIRVAAVDDQAALIPYSQINRFESIGTS